MESIIKFLTTPLASDLTLQTIFFFWYAIMFGTMLATIGSRPKRNELGTNNKKIIKGVNDQIEKQRRWDKNRKRPRPDKLIEGLLAFETVEVWECLRSFLMGKGPIYKIPDKIDINNIKQIDKETGYPTRPAFKRWVISLIFLNFLPIVIGFYFLTLIPPNERVTFFSFFAVALLGFTPFYLYRIYIGILYRWGRFFYGSGWQAYFQLGLASRPVAATNPWAHILPGLFFFTLSLLPTAIIFRPELLPFILIGSIFIIVFPES